MSSATASPALGDSSRAGGGQARRAASSSVAGVPVASAATRYEPRQPVHLGQTLRVLQRGGGDPTFRIDGQTFWRGVRTPEGPGTLRLSPAASVVEAQAWGPGAEWLIEHVPELLGHGDDWSRLDVTANPFLQDARRRLPGLRLTRTNQVVQMLIPAVLEQKVTGLEAWRAWRELVRAHGEPAPGPAPLGLMVAPDAAVWKRIPSWEWHRAGVDPQRSATIMRVCAVASALERTLTLGRGGDEVQSRLRSIVGVGVWTAAETTQRSHGDADSPSVGDFHLPSVVGWALIGKPVDDDGMLELLEPWRGDRERVMRLITGSGFRKPRFAPRLAPQDHRFH